MLGELLIGWVGHDAGRPGTGFRVRLRQDAGVWIAEQVWLEGAAQRGA